MQDELTDDEKAQYEAEWEQVSEKVLLAQIYAELQQIRVALTDGQTGSDGDDEPAMYRCQQCTATVQADERERHAMQQHKAPADMVEQMFDPAE